MWFCLHVWYQLFSFQLLDDYKTMSNLPELCSSISISSKWRQTQLSLCEIRSGQLSTDRYYSLFCLYQQIVLPNFSIFVDSKQSHDMIVDNISKWVITNVANFYTIFDTPQRRKVLAGGNLMDSQNFWSLHISNWKNSKMVKWNPWKI